MNNASALPIGCSLVLLVIYRHGAWLQICSRRRAAENALDFFTYAAFGILPEQDIRGDGFETVHCSFFFFLGCGRRRLGRERQFDIWIEIGTIFLQKLPVRSESIRVNSRERFALQINLGTQEAFG